MEMEMEMEVEVAQKSLLARATGANLSLFQFGKP